MFGFKWLQRPKVLAEIIEKDKIFHCIHCDRVALIVRESFPKTTRIVEGLRFLRFINGRKVKGEHMAFCCWEHRKKSYPWGLLSKYLKKEGLNANVVIYSAILFGLISCSTIPPQKIELHALVQKMYYVQEIVAEFQSLEECTGAAFKLMQSRQVLYASCMPK